MWKSEIRQNITDTTFYDIIISSTDIESTEIPNDVFSTTDAICLDNSRPTFSQSCPDEFISQSEFSEIIFAICVSAIIMVPSITVAVMLILTSNAKNVKKQFEVKRRRSRAMSLVVYNRWGFIHPMIPPKNLELRLWVSEVLRAWDSLVWCWWVRPQKVLCIRIVFLWSKSKVAQVLQIKQ